MKTRQKLEFKKAKKECVSILYAGFSAFGETSWERGRMCLASDGYRNIICFLWEQ